MHLVKRIVKRTGAYRAAVAVAAVAATPYAAGAQQAPLLPAPNLLWAARLDGGGQDVDTAAAIALDPKGNVIVAGSVQDHTGNWDADSDIAVAKYDGATGRQLWAYRWNGKDNKYDDAKAVAVDAAGNIYVVGNTTAVGPFGNFSDIVTLAFGPGGNLKWKQVYDGPLNQAQDSATGIALDAKGGVYVAGTSNTDGANHFSVLKYSAANGQQIWETFYNSVPGLSDYAAAIAVTPDGAGVFVTGQSQTNANNFNSDDYATVRLNGATGQQVWAKLYNGPGNSTDSAQGLALAPNGDVYVTGYSWGAGEWGNPDNPQTNYDFATIKYASATGQPLWIQRWDAAEHGFDQAHEVKVDAKGDVIVAGTSQGIWGRNHFSAVKYSPTGQFRWAGRAVDTWLRVDRQVSLALDAAGNAYVSGTSRPSTDVSYDIETARFRTTDGRLDYIARLNGGHDDAGNAIAVDASGALYVTGQANNDDLWLATNDSDFVTAKFVPYRYVATDSAIGNDGKTRLMWLDLTGKGVLLQQLSTTGAVEKQKIYAAPIGKLAHFPQAITVGSDNRLYLLWQRQDGAAVVWRLRTDLSAVEKSVVFAAPAAGYWSQDVALGQGDNKLRLTWQGGDGTQLLWRLNATMNAAETKATHQPPAVGLFHAGLSVGLDGKPRFFWGAAQPGVKNYIESYAVDGVKVEQRWWYGPYTNLIAPVGMSVGADNKPRLLFADSGKGTANLQRLSASGNLIEKQWALAAPVPGAAPLTVATSLVDSHPYVLWLNPDGRATVRKIDSVTGAVLYTHTIGPF